MKEKFEYTKYILDNRLMKEEDQTAQSFPRADLENEVSAAIKKAVAAKLTNQEILDIIRMATGNLR